MSGTTRAGRRPHSRTLRQSPLTASAPRAITHRARIARFNSLNNQLMNRRRMRRHRNSPENRAELSRIRQYADRKIVKFKSIDARFSIM
ncbi:hypothetical protein [Burkholderia sp. AW49-1]